MSSILHGKGFHCLFKVLAAAEIPANKISLSVYVFPLTYRRGKEIAILLVILDAAKCFTRIFVHVLILLLILMIFVYLSAEKTQNGTAEVGLLFVMLFLSVKGCGNAMHLALDGTRGFVYTLRPKGKNNRLFFTVYNTNRQPDFLFEKILSAY